MDKIFGKSAEPIRTADDMQEALNDLFWYRVELGLETIYMCRRRLDYMEIPPSVFEMCSKETQNLGKLYADRMMDN